MVKITESEKTALKNSLGIILGICRIEGDKFIFSEEVTFEEVLERYFVRAKEKGCLGFLKPRNDLERFIKEAFIRFTNKDTVPFAIHPITELPWVNIPVDGMLVNDIFDEYEDADEDEFDDMIESELMLEKNFLVYFKERGHNNDEIQVCVTRGHYDYCDEEVTFGDIFDGKVFLDKSIVDIIGWSEVPYEHVNDSIKGTAPKKSLHEAVSDLYEGGTEA